MHTGRMSDHSTKKGVNYRDAPIIGYTDTQYNKNVYLPSV